MNIGNQLIQNQKRIDFALNLKTLSKCYIWRVVNVQFYLEVGQKKAPCERGHRS